MDLFEEVKDHLVHLAKLAVIGDVEKVRSHLLRQSRKLLATEPSLSHVLRAIAASSPAQSSKAPAEAAATRRAGQPWRTELSAPADKDSQLGLLREEDPPRMEHAPVYNTATRRALKGLIREHAESDALTQAGLAPSRTVLFSGPPGVGKTLAARWIATELKLPLLILDLSSVMSRFLGATGANLKKAFAYALQRPCILLLDELDAVAKRRDDSAEVGELKRLVTVLLQELDEWPEGHLLIAATNHPQLLDTAVWRRFEMRIDFPRPTRQELSCLLPVLVPKGIEIPVAWLQVLPTLLSGTSYSDLTQTLRSLRRMLALEPQLSPEDVLEPIVQGFLNNSPRARRKEVALSLEQSTHLSERSISNLTGVSRDTMRRARKRTGGGDKR